MLSLSGHIGAKASALVDGQLSPAEEERAWSHVLTCPGCRRRVEREGWTGRVLLDDEGSPAASAFGLTSYPYLVLVDGDGNVVDRNAGRLGLDGLREFVGQLD